MAIIPYQYNPALQDLFLYEDHQVSWTNGSAVYKRPSAWNPTSPLYGYRKSIVGISAAYRTFSTLFSSLKSPPTLISDYYQFNSFTDANKPVYYNSYPPCFPLISKRFSAGCLHCFGSVTNRDESNRFISAINYQPNGALAQRLQFRWLNHDNTVADEISGTQVLLSYRKDPQWSDLDATGDLGVVEFTRDIAVNPVTFVDARTAGFGATFWLLDGSMKIIRLRLKKAFIRRGIEVFTLEPVNPDGSSITTAQKVENFLHDSGSRLFVEVTPPTSTAAGDGILGMVTAHVFQAYDFVDPNTTRSGYGDIVLTFGYPSGDVAKIHPTTKHSRLMQYLNFRGYPAYDIRKARSQGPTATESTNGEILSSLATLQESLNAT